MSSGDWIALASVVVGVLGVIAGLFVSMSKRIDKQDARIDGLIDRVAAWFRNGTGPPRPPA